MDHGPGLHQLQPRVPAKPRDRLEADRGVHRQPSAPQVPHRPAHQGIGALVLLPQAQFHGQLQLCLQGAALEMRADQHRVAVHGQEHGHQPLRRPPGDAEEVVQARPCIHQQGGAAQVPGQAAGLVQARQPFVRGDARRRGRPGGQGRQFGGGGGASDHGCGSFGLQSGSGVRGWGPSLNTSGPGGKASAGPACQRARVR